MLANLNFNKEFDVAPYVELDINGVHRCSDFMSGDFPWWQCVRFIIILPSTLLI